MDDATRDEQIKDLGSRLNTTIKTVAGLSASVLALSFGGVIQVNKHQELQQQVNDLTMQQCDHPVVVSPVVDGE